MRHGDLRKEIRKIAAEAKGFISKQSCRVPQDREVVDLRRDGGLSLLRPRRGPVVVRRLDSSVDGDDGLAVAVPQVVVGGASVCGPPL